MKKVAFAIIASARYRITRKWGHVQLSGFAAQLRYRFTAGGTDEVSLFGGNLSEQFNLLKRDKFIYQIVYDPGAGRFRENFQRDLMQMVNLYPSRTWERQLASNITTYSQINVK